MPGAPCAPAASRAKQKSAQVSHRRSPETPGIPRANGFNGFLRALPSEPGFLATIASAMRQHRRQLDASVGASGPHGFAVRKPKRPRQKRRSRPSHPARVRDDRETPLGRAGWLEVYCCFYRAAKWKIFDSMAGQPMQIARDKYPAVYAARRSLGWATRREPALISTSWRDRPGRISDFDYADHQPRST